MPVIGFLGGGGATTFVAAYLLPAFRQGLKDMGYVEGRNLAIEYRWAETQYDRLPALAADLVSRRPSVIFASSNAAALAAKAASSTIPIVFVIGADPVQLGLVASLARPGGNVTGVSFLTSRSTNSGQPRLGQAMWSISTSRPRRSSIRSLQFEQ
jgi:putative tryptophan/tyrosine transport system substrate-binding protein